MRLLLITISTLLLAGCTAQVSGMQSPVLHDYGSIDWIPVDRPIEQAFISGPGYSAAIANDAGTTSEEYVERLAELPEDARSGELDRLRVGLRLAGRDDDAAWSTGARLQLAYASDLGGRVDEEFTPLIDVEVDSLARSGDRIIIEDLPDVEPGRPVVLRLVPGEGPDAGRLEIGMTPWRAPYGGWRATAGGEEMRGAIVFDTRYSRQVATGEIVESGLDRLGDAGSAFLALYGLAIAGLIAAAAWIWKLPGRRAADGR